jgi:hypothetical protein
MTKSSKSFRLSEQAISSLQWVASETGANETAIIELSLAFFVSKIRGDIVNKIQAETANKIQQIPSPVPYKKRKRH